MSALAPEEMLGRYRIVGEIGRGAMGIVYKGEDTVLERVVAIKTVLVRVGSEDKEGYLARFRQEAKALAGLNHPAIITVYDFGDTGDVAYMAMELLEGRELRDLLAQARLPLHEAVEIAAQVAEGLAFAHARGIVHRDIKPGNIMVLADHRAKIMDFGIARVRVSDVKTQAGTMLGSPKYMSPEQIVGRDLDHRTDVFSLGVVLHEMLAGVPPFAGEDVHQLMYSVCNTRALPPSRLNPAVPPVLDLMVAKALEKDVQARYASAADLAADLRAFLEGRAAAATPAPAVHDDVFVVEATRPEATAPLAPAAISDGLGLSVSRGFDSRRAIARLASPRGRDRALLAAPGAPPSFLARLARDRMLAWRTAAIVAALAASAAILLL
jgi:serine/threonine protein kinase